MSILSIVLIAVCAVLFIICCCFLFDMRLKKVYYTLPTDRVDKRMRAVLITDLHNCQYGKGMCKLVSAIDEVCPDIVLYSGDIYDDALVRPRAKALFDKIAPVYPSYMALGNHEFRCKNFDGIINEIEQSGTHLLRGQYMDYGPLRIFGIDDHEGGEEQCAKHLDFCRENQADDKYNILLAHYPSMYETYKKTNSQLVLSGHMHGGQWIFPGINGLYVPRDGLFPKYCGGLYQEGEKTSLIVSRGLCRERIKCPRILNRPELVVIDIVPRK